MARSSFVPGVVLVSLSVLLAAACGGDSEGAGASVPLSDVPGEVARAFCSVNSECLGPMLDVYLQGQDCVERTTRDILQGEFSLVADAVAAGRVVYDGTQLSACVQSIEAAGCDILTTRLSAVCEGALHGTVAAGGDCSINAECQPGHFCQTGAACPGACTALLSAGQDCASDDECKSGLVCSRLTSRCVTPAAKGQACEGPSEPPCSPALACQGSTDTAAGTCAAATDAFSAAEGAACDPTAGKLCKVGLVCALTNVSVSGTGEAVLEWKCEKPATGSACHIGYPESCPDGEYCELADVTNLEGTCRSNPGDGDPCGKHLPSSTTDAICGVDAVCVDGTCRKMQSLGGACTVDEQCHSKLCVDGGCAPSKCEK